MYTFGEKLRQLRSKRKLTQREFAEKFKISESAVGMYERNERKPSFELLSDFANFFGVSTDFLLGRDPEATEAGGGRNSYTPTNIKAFLRDRTQNSEYTAEELSILEERLESYFQFLTSEIKKGREKKGE